MLDFAKLIDDPEFVDGFGNRSIGRTFLKGEFRGRKVVMLARHGNRSSPQMLVASMETRAAMTMGSHDFTGYRSDREGELAVLRWRRSMSSR